MEAHSTNGKTDVRPVVTALATPPPTPPRVPSIRQRECSWAARTLRNRLLPWTTLFLAGTAYILTIVYLWHSELVCRHTIFGRSQASALGTANILSWIANPLLAASIGQSLDMLCAMLIARGGGHSLLENLPLQAGTGIDGLFEIIVGGRRFNNPRPGAWSIFRLVAIAIVPILGIIILIDPEAVPVYSQATTPAVTRGYGIGAFNSSLAALLQPMADGAFGTRFKDFVTDQDLVVNVSNSTDLVGCSSGLVNDPRGVCRAQYFVPGGVEQFAPRLLVGDAFISNSDLELVLAKKLNGYYFQFEASNATQFDQNLECMKYGYGLASYQLCLKDVAPRKMAAFLRPCPKSLAVSLQCMSNTSWPIDEGWGTILEVGTRPADVIYNGLNGTIMDYHFLSDTPSPINITAPRLLEVFNVLFNTSNNTSTYGKALSAIGIGTNKPVEPFIIWQYFQGLAELARNDTRANSRAQTGLQSLLTIPIYHLQAKDFAELRRLLLEQIDNTTAIIQTLGLNLVNQFPYVEPDTDIFPARLRYKIKVGQSSLIAYIVLAGTSLLLCLIITLLASFTNAGNAIRRLGPFPMLTQMRDFGILDEERQPILLDELRSCEEEEVLLRTKDMRLYLAKERQPASEQLRVAVQTQELVEQSTSEADRTVDSQLTETDRPSIEEVPTVMDDAGSVAAASTERGVEVPTSKTVIEGEMGVSDQGN